MTAHNIEDMCRSLHYQPLCSHVRRGVTPVWLESAALHQDGTACLVFCALGSWRSTTINLDVASGLLFAPLGEDHLLDPTLSELNELASSTVLRTGRTPSVVETLARLTKRLQSDEALRDALWPQIRVTAGASIAAAAEASFVRSCVVSAILTLARHPLTHTAVNVDEYSRCNAVLAGLSVHIQLLVTAACTVRRHIVCAPVPSWFLAPICGDASILPAIAPIGSTRDFDAPGILAAVAGVPRLTDIAPGQRPLEALEAMFAHTPVEPLKLLYFLLAQAPVRLVRERVETAAVSSDNSGGGISNSTGAIPYIGTAPIVRSDPIRRATYVLIHGPFPPMWVPSSGSSSPSIHSPVGNAPPARAADVAVPLWDTRALAQSGTYFTEGADEASGLYHGTSSENVYSVISMGLRTLSGTRHETSGSIFGSGVYLSNELAVVRNFAAVTGVTWANMRDPFAPTFLPSAAAAAASNRAADATTPVSYQCIVECEVIAAPENVVTSRGVEQPQRRAASTAAPNRILPPGAPLPRSCYVVVRNPSHIRVTRLILESSGVPTADSRRQQKLSLMAQQKAEASSFRNMQEDELLRVTKDIKLRIFQSLSPERWQNFKERHPIQAALTQCCASIVGLIFLFALLLQLYRAAVPMLKVYEGYSAVD